MQEYNYYLSNTNAKLVIDNAIADSRLRSRMFVEQSYFYVFNTSMRLNITGVAEGLSWNVRVRKVTGSSLNREVFSSIIGILESTLNRVASHGIEFLV